MFIIIGRRIVGQMYAYGRHKIMLIVTDKASLWASSREVSICIQDTLSSRAALGLPAVQPLGRVRRASKGILHTR